MSIVDEDGECGWCGKERARLEAMPQGTLVHLRAVCCGPFSDKTDVTPIREFERYVVRRTREEQAERIRQLEEELARYHSPWCRTFNT